MKTILVVDDECYLVKSLTQLLEEEGYHVVSATNGKDGLAQLVKEHPDRVLTDFMIAGCRRPGNGPGNARPA